MRQHLCGSASLRSLRRNLSSIKDREGSYVECGVWRGGSSYTAMAHSIYLKKLRDFYLFDAFEKFAPELNESDISKAGKPPDAISHGLPYQENEDLLETAKKNFEKIAYPPYKIHIFKGLFKDTFPLNATQTFPIAFLHIDCDWYYATKLCFETFYDGIISGGIIQIDDYDFWMGSKKAVHEFFQEKELSLSILNTRRWVAHFVKP